jgi:hypothetical protein
MNCMSTEQTSEEKSAYCIVQHGFHFLMFIIVQWAIYDLMQSHLYTESLDQEGIRVTF